LLLCCGRLQVELQRVLYPLFIHVYLQLVQYGAFNMAADLLKQYRCEQQRKCCSTLTDAGMKK
jgi:hypothetical protein